MKKPTIEKNVDDIFSHKVPSVKFI